MTGGIGFAGQGNESRKENRKLLNKKEPFERMETNPFIKGSGKQKLKISQILIQKLIEVKQKKKNSGKVARLLLSGFIVAFLIYYLLFTFRVV